MVGFTESAKCIQIRKIFDDAYRSYFYKLCNTIYRDVQAFHFEEFLSIERGNLIYFEDVEGGNMRGFKD